MDRDKVMAWFGHERAKEMADSESVVSEVMYLPKMSGPGVMALLDNIDVAVEDASWRVATTAVDKDGWQYLLSEGQRIAFQGKNEKLYLMTRKTS